MPRNQIKTSLIKVQNKSRFFGGLLAIGFYITHGTYLLLNNETPHIVWACHIGSLMIGIGLILDMPVPVTIGVLWLGFGDIMWFLYLVGGGEFELTSPLTHIGGLAVGLWALSRSYIPKRSWAWALVTLLILQQISRWVTPESYNINLAFRVYEGWESVFPTYLVYFVVVLAFAGLLFFGFEILLNKLVARRKQDV